MLKRFLWLVFTACVGALLVGTLSRSPATLLGGVLLLGIGIVLGMLYYVLRPVDPSAPLRALLDLLLSEASSLRRFLFHTGGNDQQTPPGMGGGCQRRFKTDTLFLRLPI